MFLCLDGLPVVTLQLGLGGSPDRHSVHISRTLVYKKV